MERAPELEEIIAGWFKAAAQGDGSWVDRHVSRDPDALLVGTDPNEWLQGAQAGQFLKSEAMAMAGNVDVSPGQPVAYREGDVGWGITRPTLTMPDGKTLNPRWSAVFRREDGDWKAVQIHASVGISNEQLFGMEL